MFRGWRAFVIGWKVRKMSSDPERPPDETGGAASAEKDCREEIRPILTGH